MAEPEITIESKKSKLPLIIGAAGAVVVIAVVAFFFLRGGSSDHADTAKTEHAATEKKPDVKAESGGEGAKSEIGDIISINELVVNPKNSRGGRYFVTSIGVVCTSKEQSDEVKKKEPILRDRLITFFSLQTMEVLTDINRREQIKTYVKAIVDREVATGPVKEVLFSRYIVQ
ncbi:MAG: flagellar basal body-associated FliL family protein [bacterium]|nr:flagellar basal body-associated FliL family protein [bacterium]